ncbi:MAG: MFS transporter [Alphaproteobacteria bacterium]|nr:MFS transporter [Alphaproteobacteria bacterium]MCY4229859.1 MFS transporter [Alphaproteobacteria bacterium]MCY4319640.1 MFS transporter [Alphaproteobacteria bacterium]
MSAPLHKRGRLRRAVEVFQSRRVAMMLALGFSSGLPLMLTVKVLSARLAEAGVDRTSIGLFTLVTAIYGLKFLWAPAIDRLRLPWLTHRFGRRRAWMLATHGACMAAILGLGFSDPAGDLAAVVLFACLVAFSSASQDIVLDAYRIEILDEGQYGPGAAVFVKGFRIGMFASGAGGLFLADALGWAGAHAIMAALLLIGIAVTLLAPEPARACDPEAEAQQRRIGARAEAWGGAAAARFAGATVAPLAEFFTRPGWGAVLAFILFYKLGDAALAAMAIPFYIELGFSKSEIAAAVETGGFIASLAGIFVGGLVVHAMGLLPCLLVAGLLQALSNLAFIPLNQAGHDIIWLAGVAALEGFTAGLGTTALLAYLMSLCNMTYSMMQFALLSSLMASARIALSAPSGWVVDRLNGDWSMFFALTTLACLPGLLLLRVLHNQQKGGAP